METSKRYNSVPVKDNCALFATTPYFWARAIRWCHLNFSTADPCCHGNKFWDKIDYNSAPVKDNCAMFALTFLYAAARLYSVAVGQIPGSTERISSLFCFFYQICLVRLCIKIFSYVSIPFSLDIRAKYILNPIYKKHRKLL